MIRAALTRTSIGLALLFGVAVSASAQTIQNPIIPRGSLFFRMNPSATTVEGIYGPEGTGELPLGHRFSLPSIGTAEVPKLQVSADRFGALAGLLGTPDLRLGATVARFSGDERVLPLQLSYGLLDRLTLGVTVPFIRKRVETILRLSPEGADAGRNPNVTGAAGVSTFLSDAGTSLGTVLAAVEETCLQLGEQSPDCVAGRGLVGDAESFLADLDAAYEEEEVFPLDGSEIGDGISARWMGFVGQFSDWGATGPETLPLASEVLDQATFESLVVAPAWPGGGFPLETPPAVLGLGDVELNVAIGLRQPDPPPPVVTQPPGLRLHAALLGTVRFPTGAPDSLRTVAPIHPPRGVSGYSVGAVADLLLAGRLDRLAVLGTIESGWNGTREITLLAPDPSVVFTPGLTQTAVRWSPGSHIRASLTPRLRFGPTLSVGVGWQFLRQEPDGFEASADEGAERLALLRSEGSYTQHRLAFELRYVSMDASLSDAVPFPFEILFRGSRSVAGTEGAAVESRAEAMVRFRLRD